MVATRGQRSKQPSQEEEVAQPTITDYERSRERRVAANLKKMQELRLHTLRADLNNSLPQPESSKGKKSANKKTNSSDSDSSEYLLDDDDQGDSDDDDTETDEQPPPLAIKKYFNGIPANEVRTTSPVEYMTDAEWRALVAKWSDPKNMETCEKNKRNRSKVKYHQATGSRCYVAHLHAYKQKRNREEPSVDLTEELDAVEAFQTCHTSSKKGLTEPAREALLRMEALRSEPVAEGVAPASSVEVVSKVLSHNSSHQFMKSVGIKTPASSKSSSSNESELREQLAAEAAAAVQGELDELKKKSQEAEEKLARTQIELEEYKKLTERNTKEMEENNLILKKLLSLHSNAS